MQTYLAIQFIRRNAISILPAVAVISLLIGYFCGREHVKYEMRQAVQKIGEEFANGMRNAFNDDHKTGSVQTIKNVADERKKENDAREALQKEQRSYLSIKLKSFKKENYSADLSFDITNISTKAIDSFKGSISVYDQYNEPVTKLELRRDTALLPGETFNNSGSWVMGDRLNDLLGSHADKLTFFAEVEHVIFSDGQQKKYD